MLLKQITYMKFTAKYQESAHTREAEKSHNQQSAEYKN